MSESQNTEPRQVDVRGPRFAAWITTSVLVATLIVAIASPIAAGVLAALQAAIFAHGAYVGPARGLYGGVYRAAVAPRLGPVTEREPVDPLRFAQLVGFAFAAVGAVAFLAGAPVVGAVATAFALFAAFLNAAFGICLGCMLYPLVARLRYRVTPA